MTQKKYTKFRNYMENKIRINEMPKMILEKRIKQNAEKLNELRLKNKLAIDKYIDNSNKHFETFINKLGGIL